MDIVVMVIKKNRDRGSQINEKGTVNKRVHLPFRLFNLRLFHPLVKLDDFHFGQGLGGGEDAARLIFSFGGRDNASRLHLIH